MMARLIAWGLCSITVVIAAARLTLAIVDPASSDSSSGTATDPTGSPWSERSLPRVSHGMPWGGSSVSSPSPWDY